MPTVTSGSSLRRSITFCAIWLHVWTHVVDWLFRSLYIYPPADIRSSENVLSPIPLSIVCGNLLFLKPLWSSLLVKPWRKLVEKLCSTTCALPTMRSAVIRSLTKSTKNSSCGLNEKAPQSKRTMLILARKCCPYRGGWVPQKSRQESLLSRLRQLLLLLYARLFRQAPCAASPFAVPALPRSSARTFHSKCVYSMHDYLYVVHREQQSRRARVVLSSAVFCGEP